MELLDPQNCLAWFLFMQPHPTPQPDLSVGILYLKAKQNPNEWETAEPFKCHLKKISEVKAQVLWDETEMN